MALAAAGNIAGQLAAAAIDAAVLVLVIAAAAGVLRWGFRRPR